MYSPHTLLSAQANILQPLTDLGTLALRQDALGELLGADELLHDARQGLAVLPRDLDKMCAGLVRAGFFLRHTGLPAVPCRTSGSSASLTALKPQADAEGFHPGDCAASAGTHTPQQRLHVGIGLPAWPRMCWPDLARA